jgi:Rrf2 family nitric oxide-sensitive transcriptional repressor
VRLTSHSDYAFRTLLHLGSRVDEVVPVATIADTFGLSANHLAKVAQALARAGFVRTHRGPSGGLALARTPEAIRLGDVLRATEPDFHLVECFPSDGDGCPLDGACKLRDVIDHALRAFMEVFDCYTLADLLRSRGLRQRLLSL